VGDAYLAAGIPAAHSGVAYEDFMANLSAKRDTRRYLEIGVRDGQLMARIQADVAVGVDPTFVLSQNVCLNKTRVSLVTATSDRFFASPDMVGLLSGPPDLIFLDGYHTFEYLLRDFMNAEAICNDRSLIVVHDCLPIDTVMTLRHVEVWKQKTVSTPFHGWWTGDVWKLLPILAKYRPDLEIVCTDCTPTGLVCISNLSPGNGVLRENYLSIVKEFRDVPSTENELRQLYASIEITPSHRILAEFDHSSFFKV